jgi:hypothetical protein
MIGRKINSMDGPSGVRIFEIPAKKDGELIWLTAVRNRAIDADSGEEMSQEFLCHSNVSLVSKEQWTRKVPAFSGTDSLDPRVMTLIQGQNEIELPQGFGFPLVAGEPLEFFTMVINKNVDELPIALTVQTEIEYQRDDDLTESLVPLFKRRLYNLVEIEGGAGMMAGHEGMEHGGDAEMQGGMDHEMEHGDDVGAAAPSAMKQATLESSESGDTYGMHWLVPPGRHEYRTAVGDQLGLAFDATVHYVSAHLHPFGESITLIDTESGETVFRLEAHEYTDRLGIAEMDNYSSEVGKPISQHGSYELVTVYNNPTAEPIDAMGILFLYMRDEAFERGGGEASSG